MTRRKTARYTGQPFAAHGSKQLSKLPVPYDFQQGLTIGRDLVAHGVEIFWKGHVESAADEHSRWSDMEIEPRALVLTKSCMRENGSDVGLVGRFVFGETCIPINAVCRDFLRRDHLRSELAEVLREGGNKIRHRCFHVLLVNTFVFLEVFAIIIALQRPKELKTLLRER